MLIPIPYNIIFYDEDEGETFNLYIFFLIQEAIVAATGC